MKNELLTIQRQGQSIVHDQKVTFLKEFPEDSKLINNDFQLNSLKESEIVIRLDWSGLDWIIWSIKEKKRKKD